MKRKNGLVIGLLAGITLTITGCGTMEDGVNLVEAPKSPDVKQENIKEAVNKLLPQGFEFATAKYSEPKQSIFVDDLNRDGKKEGIILYKDTIGNKPVHVMVLEEMNGSWNKLTDVSTNYNYLDNFVIDDLDGDGKEEVVLGVGLSATEPKKQLLVFDFSDSKLMNKVDATYEWVDMYDYDGDNKLDILMLNGEVGKSQKAELYHYNKGQLQKQSELGLLPDGYHENIVNGKLSDGKRAVFIDNAIGAHSMLTEIITYNQGKLVLVGDPKDGVLMKEYPLYSKDINQDGVIEVGGMYIPKGYEDAAMAEIPFIYTYNDYSSDGTKQTIEQRYNNDMYHFYITIPKEWQDKVTVQNIESGIKLISADTKDTLFELSWADKTTYNGVGTKLGETKNTVFYTTSKNVMPIPNSSFHLVGEDLK